MADTIFRVTVEGSGGESGAVLKEAMQMVVQGIALLHQHMNDALRQQQERMEETLRQQQRTQEAMRQQTQDANESLRRLEDALEAREGKGASSWRRPFQQLEARCSKLEESVGRALERMFPRVEALFAQAEAKSKSATPSSVSSAAVSPAVVASTSSTASTSFASSRGLHEKSLTPSTTSSPAASRATATTSSSSTAINSNSTPPASHQTLASPSEPRGHPSTAGELGMALRRAAINGNLYDTQRLLDAGADPDHRGFLGQRPLMHAARYGHASVVALLLQRGADVHARTPSGGTALHSASLRNGDDRCVRLLLEAGASGRIG